MAELPDIETEKDLLASLKFKDSSALTEKEIQKILDSGYIKTKENIIELTSLVDILGIKKTIKYLEENKGLEFLTMLKNSPIFNEARRKYFLEATAHLRSATNIIEGIYACPKCGSMKTNTIQKQTRSSDEPTTEINSCVCGYTWRSSN